MREYPREYLQGIELFNRGEFFEAHEAWESVWLRSQGPMRLFYQALIQSAAAMLHQRNGNRVGADNLYRLSLEKFADLPDAMLGLDLKDFRGQIAQLARDTARRDIPPITLGPLP